MRIEGSYDVSRFAVDVDGEIQRLNAQVELFWPQELALYQRLGLADGMHLLDAGCASGYVIAKLLALYPNLQCTGIEIDLQLVAAAQTTIPRLYANRSRILQQSITEMDLPDASVDFVISRLVLEHLPDPMVALTEVLRVLKVGGTAVFIANDFDLHERTSPDSPALGELYDAYRRARRAEGGNPCLGRELPLRMKRAGFHSVDLQLLAAHNHVAGDAAFLKAEGSGIPVQLVKTGHLASDSLDRIGAQWRSMLTTPDHAIFRMLFAGIGKKETSSAQTSKTSIESASSGKPVANGHTELRSAAEITAFIRGVLAEEMKTPADALPTHEALIHLGVDSMAAVALCSQVEDRTGVKLPMAEILSGKSINDLTQRVITLLPDR